MTITEILFFAAVLIYIGWQLHGAFATRRKDKEIPPPQYNPADVAFRPSRWHALPGGRIELADTGFYITLNPSKPARVYEGCTPEGHAVVWGNDLASMKRYLEGQARERAEFDPSAGGWTP